MNNSQSLNAPNVPVDLEAYTKATEIKKLPEYRKIIEDEIIWNQFASKNKLTLLKSREELEKYLAAGFHDAIFMKRGIPYER
jgi:hypothetical protein